MTFTAAARGPAPDARKENSPSARHFVVLVAGQSVAPPTPFSKRGSKAQAAPAARAGPVNACVVPPPSGVKVSVGVIWKVLMFCTTIAVIGPVRRLSFAFFAAFGPYSADRPGTWP